MLAAPWHAPLYDALWVSPLALDAEAQADLVRTSPETVTVFRARHVELAGGGRNPIDAWGTAAIADQYDAFIRHWTAVLPRVHRGEVDGAEAVRLRTAVMDTYRRFSTVDPRLPVELLPAGWLRRPARETFAAVYDGLAGAAEKHVRTVADTCGADAQVRIHANTVDDLLAGVTNRVGAAAVAGRSSQLFVDGHRRHRRGG